ncbi:polysaccharide lyase [Negadavirga shengliensis]|uniref:Polysaccharide lyase n=1 Tax=Negadavirga shengliensis TaxID=1389218 RepID=A0ABV9T2F2_9BACT
MKTIVAIILALVSLAFVWKIFLQKHEEELSVKKKDKGPMVNASHIIYEQTFDAEDALETIASVEVGTPYGLTITAKPKFSKEKAARFELRDDDPMVKGSKRAEVTIVKGEEGHIGKDTYYVFDLFVPTEFIHEGNKDLINQWHQDGEAPVALLIKNGKFLLRTFIDGEVKSYDLATVRKNQWTNFKIHMVHDYSSEGLTEVWIDGRRTLQLRGKNMNDKPLPKWKIGIYKSTWASQKTSVSERVLYFDNIQVWDNGSLRIEKTGKDHSTLPKRGNEIGKGVDVDSNSETFTNSVVDLVFVNAQTEKDIHSVEEGINLNLRAIGTHKVNIRAEVENDSLVGSVKFDLSGENTLTYIDSYPPFALFGDDGNGNYYYGSGLPAGDYSLKVTPYSEAKGRGMKGATYTINFSISDN